MIILTLPKVNKLMRKFQLREVRVRQPGGAVARQLPKLKESLRTILSFVSRINMQMKTPYSNKNRPKKIH